MDAGSFISELAFLSARPIVQYLSNSVCASAPRYVANIHRRIAVRARFFAPAYQLPGGKHEFLIAEMGGHCRCSMIVTIAGLLCQPTVAPSNATYARVCTTLPRTKTEINVSRETRTGIVRLSSRCADFGTEEFLGWMFLVVGFGSLILEVRWWVLLARGLWY